MILFKPEHIPFILDGTKTQTRRIWKRVRVKVGSIHQAKLNYSKGSKPVCYIRILRVWKERLADITDHDAIAEGYQSRGDYMAAFARINKKSIDAALMNIVVDCVEFELVD